MSQLPVVASVGSDVYVTWIDSSYGHAQVAFQVSSNSGSTWLAQPLTTPFSGLSGTANAVQMFATGTYVFLTWVQGGNIAFAVSSNNGATFSVLPLTSLGTGNDPQVAASLPYVYLIWNAPGANGVYFDASSNNGNSFGTARLIGTQSGAHEAEITAVGSNVYAVWAGAQTSGEGIFVATSPDHGGTFTTQQLNIGFINRSREPMIAASGSDVYVTFTSDNTGSYHAYVAVSTNSGTSFRSPINLSGTFKSARELQVAASGSSAYVTFRGQATTSVTNQYVCATNNDGTTWNGASNCSPTNLSPAGAPSESGFGTLAIDGSNVYAIWSQPPKGSSISQMWFQASQDAGVTWAGAQQVSMSTGGAVGMNDPGAQGPMVAGSNGHVFTVWEDTSTGAGDIYFRGS